MTLDRRSFIKSTLLTSCSFLLPPAILDLWAGEEQSLRLGLITDLHKDIIHDADLRLQTFLEALNSISPHAKIQLGDFAIPKKENQAFIDRFRGTFSKTESVQSRVKMLEKIVPIEVDEVDNSALKLKFPPSVRSGQYPVVVKDLHKSYGDKVIFKDATAHDSVFNHGGYQARKSWCKGSFIASGWRYKR